MVNHSAVETGWYQLNGQLSPHVRLDEAQQSWKDGLNVAKEAPSIDIVMVSMQTCFFPWAELDNWLSLVLASGDSNRKWISDNGDTWLSASDSQQLS